MITKQDLVDSLVHEITVCQHLAEKFTSEGFDYKPSEGQRTTLELMRYISIIGSGSMKSMKEGNWDSFRARAEEAKQMNADGFQAAMERQKQEIISFFDETSDEEFLTLQAKVPGRQNPTSLGGAIVAGPLKWLSAYKLQLFLYAKASSAPDIGTANAWAGVDAPKK